MIKTNWHTHHELCGHASGQAEDYLKVAINHGLTTLGFSDHAPSDAIEDSPVRMSWTDLTTYIKDIETAKKSYQHLINIHIGLECEYFDMNPAYYQKLLHQVEYLILGQHYIQMRNPRNQLISTFALHKPSEVLNYAESVVKAIKSGYFSLIAHPDIYMCGYDRFDDTASKAAHMICEAAKTYNIPLEFNANGIRRGLIHTSDGARYPYPSLPFWKIAKEKKCNIVLSSDCHHPKLMIDTAMKKAEELIKELELSITDEITFKR